MKRLLFSLIMITSLIVGRSYAVICPSCTNDRDDIFQLPCCNQQICAVCFVKSQRNGDKGSCPRCRSDIRRIVENQLRQQQLQQNVQIQND